MHKPRRRRRAPNGQARAHWEASRRCWRLVVNGHAVRGRVDDDSEAERTIVEEKAKKWRTPCVRNGGAMSFGEYLDEWIAGKERSNTRTFYKNARRHLLETPLERSALLAVEPLAIKRLLDSLAKPEPAVRPEPLGGRARLAVFQLIHAALGRAHKLQMIPDNPCRHVEKPKYEAEEAVAFVDWEAAIVLETVKGDRFEALVLLMMTAAVGPAEAGALSPSDLMLDEGYLMVRGDLVQNAETGHKAVREPVKRRKRARKVLLNDELVAALHARLAARLKEGDANDFLFTSPKTHGPIDFSNLREDWWVPMRERIAAACIKYARAHGKPNYRFPTMKPGASVPLYALRHTANGLYSIADVAIEVRKEIMGHGSITTTNRFYDHQYERRHQDAKARMNVLLAELRAQAKRPPAHLSTELGTKRAKRTK